MIDKDENKEGRKGKDEAEKKKRKKDPQLLSKSTK